VRWPSGKEVKAKGMAWGARGACELRPAGPKAVSPARGRRATARCIGCRLVDRVRWTDGREYGTPDPAAATRATE